jgi:hypothetical protein
MKRNTGKVLLIAFSALAVIFLLLVNLSGELPGNKPMPPVKEIGVDLVVEKSKTEKPLKPAKPQSIPKPQAKPKPGKAPASGSPSDKQTGKGALPPISANYREHLGFRKYAEEMSARGAGFFILGASKKQIYKIDFAARSLRPVSVKSLTSGHFSPRTRIIEDEPALQFFLDKAQKELKISAPRIILLVPQQIENKIASSLSARGINVNNFSGFRGSYLINSGTLTLKLNEGVSKSGKQNLDIEIPL